MGEKATIVTVKGPGVEVERPVSEAQMLAVLRVLLGEQAGDGAGRGSDLRGGEPQRSKPTGGRLSVADLFRLKAPKRNPDKLLTIGYYLHTQLDHESFTAEELKSQFRHVGEKAPANLQRDLKWAIGNGWIAEDPNAAGQYYATTGGRAAVEAGFPDEVRKATKINRRRNKGKVKQTGE